MRHREWCDSAGSGRGRSFLFGVFTYEGALNEGVIVSEAIIGVNRFLRLLPQAGPHPLKRKACGDEYLEGLIGTLGGRSQL